MRSGTGPCRCTPLRLVEDDATHQITDLVQRIPVTIVARLARCFDEYDRAHAAGRNTKVVVDGDDDGPAYGATAFGLPVLPVATVAVANVPNTEHQRKRWEFMSCGRRIRSPKDQDSWIIRHESSTMDHPPLNIVINFSSKQP